jgi:hypothetical protein
VRWGIADDETNASAREWPRDWAVRDDPNLYGRRRPSSVAGELLTSIAK